MMDAKDLVCATCWGEFFDTQAFENCCTFEHTGGDYGTAQATATVRGVRGAAASGCSWCQHSCTFLPDDDPEDYEVTVRLVPTRMNAASPPGANVFSLYLEYRGLSENRRGSALLFLHAFTDAKDEASEHVTARPIRVDVEKEHTEAQLTQWVDDCKKHDRCQDSHTENPLPKRVIEVSPAGQEKPRIIETGGRKGVYVTLSYCWGPSTFLNLTKSNCNQLKTGLDMQDLPQTIQDAILVTRQLSIPYLWVDALCIIQDDEDEKIKEIALMDKVYGSSSVTIVAASAETVSHGLFHPRNYTETTYKVPFRVRSGVFGTMNVNELDAICYDERFEPIAKRAWTMQEQALSQRTLTFASHTMLWNCQCGTKTFGNSLHFPFDLDSGYNDNDEKYTLNLNALMGSQEDSLANKDKTLSRWLRLMTAYSLRTSRLERDKLNAVAGIASHPSFSSALGPEYFAGMWKYNLVGQLIWVASDRHRTLADGEKFNIRRPSNYRAPSWSWASLEGGVVYFDDSYDDEPSDGTHKVISEVVECTTQPKFPDWNPYGEILSGRLKLRGAVRKAWFDPETSTIVLLPESTVSIDKKEPIDKTTFTKVWNEYTADFLAHHPEVDFQEDPERHHGTDYRNMCGRYDESGFFSPVLVICIAVTASTEIEDGVQGLLLVEAKIEDQGTLYKRIGSFQRGKSEDFRDDLKKEVEII